VAEMYLTYLEQMAVDSEEALEATKTGDWDRMLASLSARQDCMTRIDCLPECARTLVAADRARANDLLERVAEADRESASLVAAAMASTREVLEEGERVKTTISAYRKTSYGQTPALAARFVDRQR